MAQPQTNAQLDYSLGAVSAGPQETQAGVASGELRIERSAGQTLSAVLDKAHSDSGLPLRKIGAVANPATLETNAISNKFVRGADGTELSLSPLLTQYRDMLAVAKSAVDRRLSQYHDTEGSISSDPHEK